MASTGSLIHLHTHSNKEIIDDLSKDVQNKLLYKGEEICKDYDNNSINEMIIHLWAVIEQEENQKEETINDTEQS